MKKNIERPLAQRRKAKQQRSLDRTQQIMQVTSQLLDEVGFDDLTTILITKRLGISVGSLYHYFPNKQAILYAIAENWLKRWNRVLEDISTSPIEYDDLEGFVTTLNNTFLLVYREQKGILPLIQAMYAVPELRELDEQHDITVTKYLSSFFKNIGVSQPPKARVRIASCYLEVVHAMLMLVLEQSPANAKKTLSDLNTICCRLLEKYL